MRAQLLWTLSFLSFPLGGILGGLVGGDVDGAGPALVGGLATGVVIGAGQALLSSGRLDWRRWVPATALGHGIGLLLGAGVVGYRTGLSDLVLMGALTGLVLGPAQALALPGSLPQRLLWAGAVPVLWALGWGITTSIGVEVGQQFTVFGSSGAVVVSFLLGLLVPRRQRAGVSCT